jgi:hypothetical protein
MAIGLNFKKISERNQKRSERADSYSAKAHAIAMSQKRTNHASVYDELAAKKDMTIQAQKIKIAWLEKKLKELEEKFQAAVDEIKLRWVD